MAIIMRSSGQKRDQGDKKKQIYTWVGCGLVAVLTLISVIPNAGSEPKAPDYSKFSSSRMQDLAAMPFGTDGEALGFLNNNPEYGEVVSNAQLLDTLFSAEERKERQAQDKAEGVPPPPDPEYKEIALQKEKAEEAKRIREARIERQKREKEDYNRAKNSIKNKNTKQTQQVRQTTTTKPGTLAPSGSITGGHGGQGTGTVGSIWRNEEKNIKTNNSMPSDHKATGEDIAFAKNKGRNVGLDVAAIESLKGANAESADAAAAGAIDAFQGEVKADDLAKDEAELGLDQLPTGLNQDLQDDLKRELGDDVNKQASSMKSSDTAKGKEYSVNENCMDSNGHVNQECRRNKIWDLLIQTGVELGKSLLTALIAKI